MMFSFRTEEGLRSFVLGVVGWFCGSDTFRACFAPRVVSFENTFYSRKLTLRLRRTPVLASPPFFQ